MGVQASAVRCPACQLQLCKGRDQSPHAALKEVKADQSSLGRETHFACQTCNVTLINSSDLSKPGWRQVPAVRAVEKPRT